MYQEAFAETFPNLRAEGLESVVIYSGNDMSREKAKNLHCQIIEKTVKHLFIDLNQIPSDVLERSDLYSRILRLSRRDATDFALFEATSKAIDNLLDADERSKLKTALIVAAMNKKETAELAMGLNMDKETRKNLEAIIPIFADVRLQDAYEEKVELIRANIFDLMELGDAPEEAFEILHETKDAGLDALLNVVRTAAKARDWSFLKKKDEPAPW